ncbi:MAG: TRAP transporter substrate-binding protein DctP [Proteobacteria bacterium]|nr:TRAP transporter substrate-binding protein DctP [Pseudomonadota bacterium]
MILIKICILVFTILISSSGFTAIFKISTTYPDGTYVVKTLKAAAKKIEEQTQGRVKLKFYPGGVQGDNKTVLKKIKRGILAGALIEIGAMSSEFKDAQVYNAPMVFNNFAEVDYVRERMDAQIIQGFATKGWKLFGFIDGGFAYAMTNELVTDMDGLNKQKIWVPASDPLSEKIANELGLSPIFLGIGEVHTALQTGAINAIVAPATAALILQWYSKVKYVIDVPFMYTYATLAFSDKAFAKLSESDQILVSEVLSKTLNTIDKNSRIDNLKAFKALQTQGLKVVSPSQKEQDSLRHKAHEATKRLVEQGQFSPKALEQLKRLLIEFRTN